MSKLLRLGAVSVVGFAFSTSTSVQAMEAAGGFDDLLSIDETPLTSTELSEARGGFSFGGFNFDFGVEVSPVEAIPATGVFGDGGVFGNGASGKDGVFGKGGVFGNGRSGADGVFGNKSKPNNNAAPAAQAATSNAASQSIPAATQSSQPRVQSFTPAPASNAGGSQSAPALASAPAPVVVQSAPVPTPVVVSVPDQIPAAVTPIPVVEQSSTPEPVVTMVVPITPQASETEAAQNYQMPTATPMPSKAPDTNAGGGAETAVLNTKSAPSGPSGPSMGFKSTSRNNISQVSQRLGPNGRTVIIDNSMNGVMLRQTIDLNVRVLNFNSRINRAIADTVTATLTSRNLILNSF